MVHFKLITFRIKDGKQVQGLRKPQERWEKKKENTETVGDLGGVGGGESRSGNSAVAVVKSRVTFPS